MYYSPILFPRNDNLSVRYLLQQYQSSLEGNFGTYLNFRHMYYNLQKRWLEQPFWQRRTKLAAAEFSNVTQQ